MIIRVTTENDSVYQLDTEQHTWARSGTGPRSGHLRTQDGVYSTLDLPGIGQPMVMTAPPLAAGTVMRVITTSWVMHIEYSESETEEVKE